MYNAILFFDDYMLREYKDVRKRYFPGTKIHEILPQYPTESGGRIVHYAEEGLYRIRRSVIVMERDRAAEILKYTSKDLINWEIQSVEPAPEKGSPETGNVIRDIFEPDPQKRFKSVFLMENRKNRTAQGYIATSSDGENWNCNMDYHFCNHISDGSNMIFYNPIFKEYQLLYRAVFIDRRIFCSYSKDLINWSKPKCLMSPRVNDSPNTEYYSMVVFPQKEGYFLGYLHVYIPPMYDTKEPKMAGKTDTYLVYSYDGNYWQFAWEHPIVERPMPPEYGCMSIYMHSLELSPDKKNWIMSGDFRNIDHACGFKPSYPDSEMPALAKSKGFSSIGICKVRREGFVGLESNSNESSVIFKRIILHGEDLFFNVNASLGWVKFQISDQNGVIPGFSFADNIPFADDDQTRYRPRWKTKDISELKGISITIQIKMYMAVIFSVTGEFYVHVGDTPTQSLGDAAAPEI